MWPRSSGNLPDEEVTFQIGGLGKVQGSLYRASTGHKSKMIFRVQPAVSDAFLLTVQPVPAPAPAPMAAITVYSASVAPGATAAVLLAVSGAPVQRLVKLTSVLGRHT